MSYFLENCIWITDNQIDILSIVWSHLSIGWLTIVEPFIGISNDCIILSTYQWYYETKDIECILSKPIITPLLMIDSFLFYSIKSTFQRQKSRISPLFSSFLLITEVIEILRSFIITVINPNELTPILIIFG